MPKVKRTYLTLSILGIYVKGKYLGIYVKWYLPRYLPLGIYLFTNRVIANFGSNVLKISRDFADLPVGKT